MNIEKRSVSELLPAPYNPRIDLKPGDPVWERLERSIDEFELVQPIVWNRQTGHVVSGHQRLAVMQHRGTTEVECVVVDLPLEKEKALNVTLNNSNVGSDWDAGKLIDLVADLQDLPDFDATLTGFDEQQLRDIVLSPAVDATEFVPEEDNTDKTLIRAILEIPEELWIESEILINDILQVDSRIRLHVSH